MSQNTEQGSASILIELLDGNITVKHGTDGNILHQVEGAAIGSWDQIWAAIENIQPATDPNQRKKPAPAFHDRLREIIKLIKENQVDAWEPALNDTTNAAILADFDQSADDEEPQSDIVTYNGWFEKLQELHQDSESLSFNSLIFDKSIEPGSKPLDAIEVHGCMLVDNGAVEQTSDEFAQFYSVYAHLRDGGLVCVADCSTRDAANALKDLLYKVADHWYREPEERKVLIEVRGGCIATVNANKRMDYVVVDYDNIRQGYSNVPENVHIYATDMVTPDLYMLYYGKEDPIEKAIYQHLLENEF